MEFRSSDTRHSWGRLTVQYEDATSAKTVDKRGYDIHGAWLLGDHASFDVGTKSRENEDHSTYALLRWHLSLNGDLAD